jgi:hypothetical protein
VPGERLAYAPCAPHVRLMCARHGADGYLRFSLVSYNWRAESLNGFCDSGTADTSILDRSSLRRRLTTAYGCSVLRRRQRPTTTAAYDDDGSVLRRRQRTTTMAGDGRHEARQRRQRRRQTTAQRHRPILSGDDGSGRNQRRRHRRQHQSRPRIETTFNRRPG